MKWIKADGESSPPQNDNYDCSTYKVPVVYLTKSGYRDLSCAWADVQDGNVLWFCDAKDCERVLYWLDEMPEWNNLPIKPKLTWQRSTKRMPDIWIPSTDEEYEIGRHIERFNWRRVEK